MFDMLEIPVFRKNLAQRLFEVLDAEGNGHISFDEFKERTFLLKAEGRRLQHDQTLLLLELRHLNRRLRRIEANSGNPALKRRVERESSTLIFTDEDGEYEE